MRVKSRGGGLKLAMNGDGDGEADVMMLGVEMVISTITPSSEGFKPACGLCEIRPLHNHNDQNAPLCSLRYRHKA